VTVRRTNSRWNYLTEYSDLGRSVTRPSGLVQALHETESYELLSAIADGRRD
jgi:hypothetical protein